MEMNGYIPRIIDPLVDRYLRAFGAVEIAGTMWSGKTWTSMRHANSDVSLINAQTRQLAELDPSALLAGDKPRVIDEWQEVPEIWDVVRQKVDESGSEKGLFILTGSSSPAREKVHHSGAGRIARLKMRPMTLQETGLSDSSVSLSGLFEKRFEKGAVSTDLFTLSKQICRGGWPAAIDLSQDDACLVPPSYIDAFLNSAKGKVGLSSAELRLLLSSLARNVGSAPTIGTLAKDVFNTESISTLQRQSISESLSYFEDHYLVVPLHGWDAPIKSPNRLRIKPKRVFADPSLPAAILGLNDTRLLENMQLFGQLFEELCMRDLSVYSQSVQGSTQESLMYYRDSDGLEVDAIIELSDGRWGAIEIKLGANKVEQAEKNLLRLKNKIAANPAARNPEPSFMAVLVGKTDFKYETENGIYVFPITCLAP